MFKDNGDGTVTDQRTGLVWQQNTDSKKYNWQDALKYCENLDLAGHTDWRLPTICELLSIVDYSRCDPAIDPVFEADPYWYWSSSKNVGDPSYAWYVSFYTGVIGYFPKWDVCRVRAVRGVIC